MAGLDEAIDHINRYSTQHSDAIVTRDAIRAGRFLGRVDSATVYWNASTRFTDGGEFGFGAEMGISTQKLHCRGPFALPELTSVKYQITGSGQSPRVKGGIQGRLCGSVTAAGVILNLEGRPRFFPSAGRLLITFAPFASMNLSKRGSSYVELGSGTLLDHGGWNTER